MTDKSLKSKAIDIKGKKYILVSDRVLYFNETYPNGCIQTRIEDDGTKVLASAKVIPDVSTPDRYFTGNSQATWGDGYINKTSALENSETSAVGRALAFLGIGVLDSIASVDEIKKTEVVRPYNAPKTSTAYTSDLCPKCKGRLLSGGDGSRWELKCENNKYINGKQSGCTFIKWAEDPKQLDYGQENSDPANAY